MIKDFDKYTKFVKLNFLDKILNSVKQYLPEDLKYIRIYQERVGYQQYSLDLTFYNEKFKKLNIDHDFTEEESEKYGYEECVFDYISNGLWGGVHDTKEIDWRESVEFNEKIRPEEEYWYEYNPK